MLDSAYLARLICDAIAGMGMTPRILPKSNTTCKNGGSQTWGEMTRTHRDDLDKFTAEYHQRSISRPSLGQSRRCTGTTFGAGGSSGRTERLQSGSFVTT